MTLKQSFMHYLNKVLFFYNLAVVKLIQMEDKQRRQAQHKKEYTSPKGLNAQFIRWQSLIKYWLGRKRFSLREQKDLIETLKLSVKFGNAISQPFEFMAMRKDLRLFTRMRLKQVAEELSYQPLHECLAGKNILDDEYVTQIKVASRTREYIPTYDSILESITDKQKRRTVFMIIMIQPFGTLLTALGIEIYIALEIVPDLIISIPKEDAPPILASYIGIREILMEQKLEYAFKISLVLAAIYGFFKIPATKFLMDLLFVQIPGISKYIAQWEVSKFFNSIHIMIQTGSSMQEACATSINLIGNRAIRHSLTEDMKDLGNRTNDLSSVLQNSVYVDLRIRNQLKISMESGSDGNDILTSVVEEYKDSMKKLLEAPASIVIPVMLASGGIYLFVRLLPLFTEINNFMQNIG